MMSHRIEQQSWRITLHYLLLFFQTLRILKLFCQPTAWDGDPVPTDLPKPSARYKEMYKQYDEDMKKSYREHTNPNVNQVRLDSYAVFKIIFTSIIEN